MQQLHHTIFPGGLMPQNRSAIDWGQQGLLAYGAWTYVVIADLNGDVKRIQTLDGHGQPITRVRWAREQLQFRNENVYSMLLASGDQSGAILVWKATEATIVASMNPDGQEKLGAVIDLAWHPDKPYLLVAIHEPSTLVLWNISTSSQVWRCDFGETLTQICMNPFDKQHVCLTSNQGWIYFIRDFKEDSKPVRIDVKYRINSGAQVSSSDSKSNPAASQDSFQHMVFSPHQRNIVYFVLDRRILIFDLTIHQTIGSIAWDKSKPAFRSLMVSRVHQHVLFLLHDDGSVTAWRRRDGSSQSFAYQASVDVVKISKQTRKRDRSVMVASTSISPSSKLQLSLLATDGVVWGVSYEGSVEPVDQNNTPASLMISGELECINSTVSSLSVWNSELYQEPDALSSLSAIASSPIISSPTNSPASRRSYPAPIQASEDGVHNPSSTSFQGNSVSGGNLVAVGTHDGRMLLIDMVANSILRMFNVQSGLALRGVRWISPQVVICFTTEPVDKHTYRNKIKIIDLSTGSIREIRKKNEPEPTFIRGIRLSPSKAYLIVLLKDQPFQVWELKSGSLLRSLPFPHITALEWDPAISYSSTAPSQPSMSANSSMSSFESNLTSNTGNHGSFKLNSNTSSNTSTSTYGLTPLTASFSLGSFGSGSFGLGSPFGPSSSTSPQMIPREQFVFSNADGTLHFYQVENSQVQTAHGLKVDQNMGVVASLAWKDNILVAGDTNGTLISYHLDKKKVNIFEPGKGLVRRIRFSPSPPITGLHHILVLFHDGDFGIWDLDYNVRTSISSYFRARDLKALDIDWFSASQPIVATTDGAIRLVDKALSQGSNSPILFTHITYPLNCPLLLPPRQALHLKVMLMHPNIVDTASSTRTVARSPSKHNSVQLDSSNFLTGLVPDHVLSSLSEPTLTICDKAILIAEYFGNATELRFWTLVRHVFKMKRTPPVFKGGALLGPSAYTNESPSDFTIAANADSSLGSRDSVSQPLTPLATESATVLTASSSTSTPELAVTNSENTKGQTRDVKSTLPVHFDLLLDPEQLRNIHMNATALQEKKRAQNYQLTQNIADFHLTLGLKEKAMEFLLETPPDNSMYYADVLKACVVAASISTDTFKNTVKLVGTSLIANGSVNEGVQLLALIGKSLDACLYLQSHDRWVEAAQLAKLTLGYDDAGHIFKKWAQHLASEEQWMDAIEIEVTLGEYDIVLDLLHRANMYELAPLFALAAWESDILTPEWLATHPSDPDTSLLSSMSPPLPALFESVFLDYGFYLNKIGCKAAAIHFLSTRAGNAGKEMLSSIAPTQFI